jgi:hypothetical protein
MSGADRSWSTGRRSEPATPRPRRAIDFMSCKQEIFISVDVETAGPIPGEFSLLSIGACDVFEPAKTFACALRPVNRNFDPKALLLAPAFVSGNLDLAAAAGGRPSRQYCMRLDQPALVAGQSAPAPSFR